MECPSPRWKRFAAATNSQMSVVFGSRDETRAWRSLIFCPARSPSFNASSPKWKPRSMDETSLLIWNLRCAFRMTPRLSAESRRQGAMEMLPMRMLLGFLHGLTGSLDSRCSQRVPRGLAHLQAPVIARLAPVHLRQHERGVRPVAVLDRDVHQRVQQGIRKQMRLQAQIDQLGVLCVVVVLLGFHAWILQVVDLNVQAELFARSHSHLRKVAH